MIDNQISLSYKSDPETILLEQERKIRLLRFWQQLKANLSDKEFKYLATYVNCKNNYHEAARILNTYHKEVMRIIELVQEKAAKIAQWQGVTMDDLKQDLHPQINDFFTQKASNVGYPSEAYINLPANRWWSLRYGSQRFPTNKRCLIPEFLEASECKCNCNICIEGYKCTRIDAYPENAEPKEYLAKKEKQLREIIKEIQSEMTEADWQLERVVNI